MVMVSTSAWKAATTTLRRIAIRRCRSRKSTFTTPVRARINMMRGSSKAQAEEQEQPAEIDVLGQVQQREQSSAFITQRKGHDERPDQIQEK